MNQTNAQPVTDPATQARRAIAGRMRVEYDARQSAENERRRIAEEASQAKAKKEAEERAEKEAKVALERDQLRHLNIQEILQLPKLPRITFTASYHFGTIVADFGVEAPYILGKGNGAESVLGVELIVGLAIGMGHSKMTRGSLQSIVGQWAKDGKISYLYPITEAARRSVKWGELVDYYGLEFASIDYPAPILDDAVEQDMRRRFVTLLEPNSR